MVWMATKVFVENFEKIKIKIHIMYFDMACCEENIMCDLMTWKKTQEKRNKNCMMMWAYLQLGYPKGQSNEKKTTKDYFEFSLHILFHDYSGSVYDYN